MKIVITGNDMIGYKFYEKIVVKAKPQKIELIVFGEEIRLAYNRVHLSEFFIDESADDNKVAACLAQVILFCCNNPFYFLSA